MILCIILIIKLLILIRGNCANFIFFETLVWSSHTWTMYKISLMIDTKRNLLYNSFI